MICTKDKRNPRHPVLIVDDEEHILLAIDTTLRMAGINNLLTCQDSREVMSLIQNHQLEVVLLDLTMPHVGGEELLALINCEFPHVPVVIVTGSMDIETAVRCMKSGAFDYVVKPLEEERLLSAVTRSFAFRELQRENRALKHHILTDKLENPHVFEEVITASKKMFSIFQYVEAIAQSPQPVLVTGETGTGKELIAKAIHAASGRSGKYVAVNVAGLDDNVFSDTLFGHVRGAFTGADGIRRGLVEQAAGGTILLDEIGDLSHESQIKLLRFLQDGEYFPLGQDEPKQTQVRVVAVTNVDLAERKNGGHFRKDLYYRLQKHQIHLPPLRERQEDIPLLLDHFTAAAALDLNKTRPAVPPALYALMAQYSFPGNIRELEAMVFDAVSRHKSGTLPLNVFRSCVGKELENELPLKDFTSLPSEGIIFPKKLPTLKQAAKLLVAEAMKRANGRQSTAAAMLGVTQQALSKRLIQGKKQAKKDGSL